MSSLSTVFQAKLMAILIYTELLLSKQVTKRGICICSDSRVAIAALAKPPPNQLWYGRVCKH
jgi:hypothetical protein